MVLVDKSGAGREACCASTSSRPSGCRKTVTKYYGCMDYGSLEQGMTTRARATRDAASPLAQILTPLFSDFEQASDVYYRFAARIAALFVAIHAMQLIAGAAIRTAVIGIFDA
jgi:hypothetical protein